MSDFPDLLGSGQDCVRGQEYNAEVFRDVLAG